MAQIKVEDYVMEQVYRYVNTLGWERAITTVAGEKYDAKSDCFVPDIEFKAAITKRYNKEMQEFIDNGGY